MKFLILPYSPSHPTHAGCTQSSTSATTSLRDEIEQRRAESMEVFAKKDPNGFVSFFTPDATLMFPDSDFIQGEEGNI